MISDWLKKSQLKRYVTDQKELSYIYHLITTMTMRGKHFFPFFVTVNTLVIILEGKSVFKGN